MDNIIIRKAAVSDAARLLAIYAPYVRDTAITFEYEVPTKAEFESRIANTLKKYPYLVAVVDGVIAGYAYAGMFHERRAYDWSVETSIYVDKNMKKIGIGGALHQALCEELKSRGFFNMNACISYTEQEDEYLDNNSMKFHEHLGYRLVGQFHKCGYKFDRWYDMIWMEKLIGEHNINPKSPFKEQV